MALMDGTGSSSSSNSNRGNRNNNSNIPPLGIKRQSSKIGKSVKRTGSGGAAPQHYHHSNNQQQQNKQNPPPPPVYNINKNDFRNVVQRLTGSPLPERYDQQPMVAAPVPAPAPPPSNSKPPNSRLHRIRPPPLSAISPVAAAGVAPLPSVLRSPFSFSPLPVLTPGDAVWAGNMALESPVTLYMKYLQDSMGGNGNASPRGAPPPHHYRPASQPPLLPSPRRPPPPPLQPLPSPTSQFLLPSPLPSPGAFLGLPSPGSPFPSSFFAQSPSGQFGFPGGASSLPSSPVVMFPLPSPTGRFPLLSPPWREHHQPDSSFSFPDPDRRL